MGPEVTAGPDHAPLSPEGPRGPLLLILIVPPLRPLSPPPTGRQTNQLLGAQHHPQGHDPAHPQPRRPCPAVLSLGRLRGTRLSPTEPRLPGAPRPLRSQQGPQSPQASAWSCVHTCIPPLSETKPEPAFRPLCRRPPLAQLPTCPAQTSTEATSLGSLQRPRSPPSQHSLWVTSVLSRPSRASWLLLLHSGLSPAGQGLLPSPAVLLKRNFPLQWLPS